MSQATNSLHASPSGTVLPEDRNFPRTEGQQELCRELPAQFSTRGAAEFVLGHPHHQRQERSILNMAKMVQAACRSWAAETDTQDSWPRGLPHTTDPGTGQVSIDLAELVAWAAANDLPGWGEALRYSYPRPYETSEQYHEVETDRGPVRIIGNESEGFMVVDQSEVDIFPSDTFTRIDDAKRRVRSELGAGHLQGLSFVEVLETARAVLHGKNPRHGKYFSKLVEEGLLDEELLELPPLLSGVSCSFTCEEEVELSVSPTLKRRAIERATREALACIKDMPHFFSDPLRGRIIKACWDELAWLMSEWDHVAAEATAEAGPSEPREVVGA